MEFRESIAPYAEEPLTRQLLLDLLKDYKRPNDKIHELVKKGELTPLKKGFYIPGPKLNIPRPESFLVANHLWGPSYVSLETALAWWGFIPERVYEVSSVTAKIAKSYKTPLGTFRYTHVPLPYYAFGQKSVLLTPKQRVLIASPEKALCDTIIGTAGIFLRSINQTREYLLEDLRIEEDRLQELLVNEISLWVRDAPKKSSLQMLVNTLKNL